jgi:copper chaperone CopZ
MSTQTFTVSGMTCHHCVNAVTEEVSVIDGVTSVEIELVPEGISTVNVTSDHPLDVESVRSAVDEAGYELTGSA